MAWAAAAHAGGVLDHARAAGVVACAGVAVQDDFTKDDTHGSLEDLTLDFCRALAAATLGEPARIRVTLYPDQNHALAAVQSGAMDVMVGASASRERAVRYGVAYAPPLLFDGQGFLVARGSAITRFAQLAGKPVCYISGTENERRLLLAADTAHVAINRHPFEEVGEMQAALVAGHCAAITGDVTQLAEGREAFHGRRGDFVILPDLIALDPVTPAYSAGDPPWGAVVELTLAALLAAEEMGITQATVAETGPGADPLQRPLLGAGPGVGRLAGLPDDWARAGRAGGGPLRRDVRARSRRRVAVPAAARCQSVVAGRRPDVAGTAAVGGQSAGNASTAAMVAAGASCGMLWPMPGRIRRSYGPVKCAASGSGSPGGPKPLSSPHSEIVGTPMPGCAASARSMAS